MRRSRVHRRLLVEDCVWVSAEIFRAAGVFQAAPGMVFNGRGGDFRLIIGVRPEGQLRFWHLAIASTGSTAPVQYAVRVERTTCYFGGHRSWFLCPNCASRAARLYLPPFETKFLCRRCHDLTYRSVQTHDARVDALAKLPDAELSAVLAAGGRRSLLAVAAVTKKLQRLSRRSMNSYVQFLGLRSRWQRA